MSFAFCYFTLVEYRAVSPEYEFLFLQSPLLLTGLFLGLGVLLVYKHLKNQDLQNVQRLCTVVSFFTSEGAKKKYLMVPGLPSTQLRLQSFLILSYGKGLLGEGSTVLMRFLPCRETEI